MDHRHVPQGREQTPCRFITIGEIMLRLTPPNYEKIRTAAGFEASYGGSEANIALALSNLGIDSTFSRWFPTTAWEKAPSACCGAMTYTAGR